MTKVVRRFRWWCGFRTDGASTVLKDNRGTRWHVAAFTVIGLVDFDTSLFGFGGI